MKTWKKRWLSFAVVVSFGLAGSGSFLLFLLAPLERELLHRGWSQAQIDHSLPALVYGWFLLGLGVALLYYRATLSPRVKPRPAYAVPAVLGLAAVVVLILLLRTHAPLLALYRGSSARPRHASREQALEEFRAERFREALPLLELVAKGSNERAVHLALARTYLVLGRNLDGAKTYRAMIQRTPNDPQAVDGFLGIYGYPDYRPDLPLTPPPRPRPAELQMRYRTQGEFFQALEAGEWQTVYLTGVNLGPAQPGEFPSTASRDFGTYYEWLEEIGTMHANTVRVYSILPPAFYQALRRYNQTARTPLWLIHEVWIHDQTQDLFDPESKRQFEQEVKNVVDVVHGQADVPCRAGANCGIYMADVSPWVIGLAVGREIEPVLALRTNHQHPQKTSYAGRYVSLPQGNPSEAWFAEECDFAIRYELEKYNTQQPITVVNWPPLDPLTHRTDATYAEEHQFRKRDGEGVEAKIPEYVNDMDATSLDVTRFERKPEFEAGLFALYHVYQHWPDFLFHEPAYGSARDSQGMNRYLGYLRDLKSAHKNFPLLIGEYGLSTSWGVAHIHPEGWNNGGFTDRAQADLLVRFARNIRDTGCAGGIVFEWQDEWFKHVHDLFTADFEVPQDRDRLWNNELDPEEHFGVIGYEAAAIVPMLRGDAEDWQAARVLYTRPAGSSGRASAGPIRTVSAMADYAYLYLRLDVDPQGKTWWNQSNYWVALNTLPGQAGSRTLPGLGVRLESGANFLLQLGGPRSSRLLIAHNYNPNESVPVLGVPEIRRKTGMNVGLADQAGFEDMVTDANPSWYNRLGDWFPPQEFNRSPIAQGTADRNTPGYNSHALWNADARSGMIEVRLPWGLLYVTDPSSLQAFAGTDRRRRPIARSMQGISVAVFAMRAGRRPSVTGSFPAIAKGRVSEPPATFLWKPWDEAPVRPYFKPSYYALQREWERTRQGSRSEVSTTH